MICPVCFGEYTSEFYRDRKLFCSRECRERVRPKRPSQTKGRREKAILALGGACAMCGNSDIRVLEVDHKHNDGAQERASLSRSRMLTDIVHGNQDRYQVLCRNCNYLKYLSTKEKP